MSDSAQRYSAACENNKAPILAQLQRWFSQHQRVLEIGSGTGQHAAHFASHLAHLIWLPTDVSDNHASIVSWLEASGATNWEPPKRFFIGRDGWPDDAADAVFSANTAHIMQVPEARQMMALIAQRLPLGGTFCQYGPFRFDGQYTSDSNRQFDLGLQQQGYGGLRDISELAQWAEGLQLQQCVALPANNHLLVWNKL